MTCDSFFALTCTDILFGNASENDIVFIYAREPCARTAQSSRVGCSRRVHKIVYLAVKMGNISVNILLLKIFSANYFHLKFQLCIC